MQDNIILKYGLTLFLITAISVGVVSAGHNVTAPIIEQQQMEKDNAARKAILPDAADFEKMEIELPEGVIEVYEGKGSDGNTIGYAIKTGTKGYGGEVPVTTGISTDGKINGIALGTLSETPGLGARAAEEAFYGQFAGKEAQEIKVKKNGTPADDEIIAISGATITSTAVTKGVDTAIELYNNSLKK